MVEREAGPVDEAKTGGGAGNLGDKGGLAKTHLTNALAETLVAPQFADPSSQSRRELAKSMKMGGTQVRHKDETEYQDSISNLRQVNKLS